jgi:uncharacterized protein (DUF1015 family)
LEVLPLNAIVYNQEKVDLKDVVAPPYDVIDKNYQEELYERSQYNIVRLILNKSENKYEEVQNFFKNWKENEVLVKTQKPSIFYIVQKYKNEKGKLIERKGFIARNKIESFDTKKILPHEFTMGGPKQDRLNLVSATEAFFSQIFMVYDDPKKQIEKMIEEKYLSQKPYMDVIDDLGIQNIVYLIDDVEDLKLIETTLEDKTLLIADGHHRYETSMNYSNLHPENEYAKYVMSYFTNASDENLIIYPTHRIIEKEIDSKELLSKVEKYYDIEILNDKETFLNKIEEENKKQITTGLILKNDSNFYVLKLKQGANKEIDAPEVLQKLDLTVLHELILKKELNFTQDELMAQNGIKYEKKEEVAFNSIQNGSVSAIFIMAYPKMQDIIDISSNGYRMPQKSTYFYPKLLSGLVINPLS